MWSHGLYQEAQVSSCCVYPCVDKEHSCCVPITFVLGILFHGSEQRSHDPTTS